MKYLLILPLLLLGCSSPKVPATSVGLNKATGEWTLTSPKNVSFSYLKAEMGTNFSLVISNYCSTNDLAIVATVSTAQALVASNASQTISSLANLAAQAVAKAP